jgi:hypothetical protein
MTKAWLLVFALTACGKKEPEGPGVPELDALVTKLTGEADAYCKCLETGTIQSCNQYHLAASDSWDQIRKQSESSYVHHVIEKADYDRLQKAGNQQFDRKAMCAKARMAKP